MRLEGGEGNIHCLAACGTSKCLNVSNSQQMGVPDEGKNVRPKLGTGEPTKAGGQGVFGESDLLPMTCISTYLPCTPKPLQQAA